MSAFEPRWNLGIVQKSAENNIIDITLLLAILSVPRCAVISLNF